MIWHVMKKDFRLLWWLVLIVAAVKAVYAVLMLRLGIFPDVKATGPVMLLGDFAYPAAFAFLILKVMHQDAAVGATQDWLARPFDRRLVLLAKLLFVLAAVHGPMLIVDFAVAMVHGFAAGQALSGALAATTHSFVFVSLPVMMAAAITETLAQGAIVAFAVCLGSIVLPTVFRQFNPLEMIPDETYAWTLLAPKTLLILAGAAVVLSLAYARRQILQARIAFAAGFVLLLAVNFTPVSVVFAATQAAASEPSAADAITIAYDPALPPFRQTGASVDVFRFLPVRVSGLPADSILRTDWLELRLVAADGRVLYTADKEQLYTGGMGKDGNFTLSVYHAGPGTGESRTHQVFKIPMAAYLRVKDQPVRVVVDYTMTLFGRQATARVPVLFGRQKIDGIGICASRASTSSENEIEVACYQAPEFSHCLIKTVENTKTGERNPPEDECYPSYQPALLRAARVTEPARQAMIYGYADWMKSKRYPVRMADIATSQFAIAAYASRAHLQRHYETPLLYLDTLKPVNPTNPIP